MNKNSFRFLLAAALIIVVSLTAFADVIRLKDGTVIRGEVVGFKDQQFIVLVGAGSRGGRRSRLMLYMEDVESIEFETGSVSASVNNSNDTSVVNDTATTQSSSSVTPPVDTTTTSQSNTTTSQSSTQQSSTQASSPAFFQVNARVRGDSTTNGWTNSGLVVRRGQRLRINATGRITISTGRFSTPAGLATVQDRDKLMRNEPTGALIAVIGDDNDDFIFIGRNREFVAQRDGVLFLGVNEGNLNDNSGAYDVVIEAEAVGSTQR